MLLKFAKLLITAGLLAWVFGHVDLGTLAATLRGIDAGWLAVALGLLIAQAILGSRRWQWVLAHLEISMTPTEVLRLFWIGLFFSQVLPTSIGGDAVRGYSLSRNGHGWAAALASVVLDRLAGLIALTVLVGITLPLAYQFIPAASARQALTSLVVLLILAVGVFFAVATLLQRWALSTWLRAVVQFSAQARSLLLSWTPGLSLVVTSLAIQLLSVTALIVLAHALGLPATPVAMLVVVPYAMLLMALPVSIAGWGVRESVLVVGLGYAGLASAQALALSLSFGVLQLCLALPGGVLWLREGGRGLNRAYHP